MSIRILVVFAAVAAIVLFFAGTASATPIALLNPLMQDPPSGTWPGPPIDPPWDSTDDGGMVSGPSGWQTVYGTGTGEDIVEYNPTVHDFASAAGNGILPSPLGIVQTTLSGKGASQTATTTNTLYGGALSAPASGSQALFNISTIDNDIAILGDTGGVNGVPQTAVSLQPHTIYTITVAIGQGLTNPLAYYTGFALEIANETQGGQLLNVEYHSTGQDAPAVGTFYDYSIVFNADDFIGTGRGVPHAGDGLRFGAILGAGAYATDIRLDETVVPEPSTLVLLASGLAGMLAYAWRKRR